MIPATPKLRGHRLTVGILAVLMTVMATSCAASTSNTPQDSETAMTETLSSDEFAAMQGRLEQLMPALETAGGRFVDLHLNQIREVSCLRIESEKEQTQTSWHGELSGPAADPETANAALDAVRDLLLAEGWELSWEKNEPQEEVGRLRELSLHKDGLKVAASYARDRSGYGTVLVLSTTRCTEHPEDHQMLRSSLDPEYGVTHPNYTDGDD